MIQKRFYESFNYLLTAMRLAALRALKPLDSGKIDENDIT
jgi:hypothetical protein